MDSIDEFNPRNYQTILMEIALKKNSIIYLPTGAGKTYIAIMVLKQMSADLQRYVRVCIVWIDFKIILSCMLNKKLFS